jgi:hypothetical protein
MAICFALQGGTILLVFVVALTISDTNYGKEETVVPPKDLVKTVGEKNAIHAGSIRAGTGPAIGMGGESIVDDEATVGQVSQAEVGETMRDESGKKY